MIEPPLPAVKENKLWKGIFAVMGIMTTLVIYGVLQVILLWLMDPAEKNYLQYLSEKIMRVPYGGNKEFFKYSLFLVFCNRITTSAVSAISLVASKKALDPVAPIYKYCLISVSNILTTTCQYEALKYVSFPVQTLAKCAKMIPVMIWGTIIMQKRYKGKDYLLAVLVTLGCSIFILYPEAADISPYNRGRESTVWGVFLMVGYLGYTILFYLEYIDLNALEPLAIVFSIFLFCKFVEITANRVSDAFAKQGVDRFDGFTSTFQDKLFKGYDMEIHNQIFYTTLCSCVLSLSGLVLQGHLLLAVDFVYRHKDCFFDVLLLSTVATASQFFISYTIRTFGALTFATIMTTRQLVSIMLSCVWFSHPLSWKQWIGATIVFGSLYAKSFVSAPKKPVPENPASPVHAQSGGSRSQNDKP